LTLSGQTLTAAAVDLSGADATGTLNALRFPALTGAVTTAAGSLATTITNDSVTTVKILNANVTTAKIADGAVSTAKIANAAVTFDKIQTMSQQTLLGNKSPATDLAGEITLGAGLQLNSSTGVLSVTIPTSPFTSEAAGLISAADWVIFNGKQNALTNPVTGTGTSGYLTKWNSNATVGASGIFTSGDNTGFGVSSPSAILQLKAGTATAGTAPLKLTAGTNLTTPETGAIEFDGTNLFITNASGRKTISTTDGGGMTSALNSGNIYVGSASNLAAAVAMSGDVTISNTGVTSIGATKVTNAMLGGSIAASKLVGTDIATVGTITSGIWNGSVVGSAYGGAGSVNGILKANGTGTVTAAASGTDYSLVREVTDETGVSSFAAATAGQTSFTLSQSPASTNKIKMYINGIRVSNAAYTVVLATKVLTYIPANNGSYAIIVGDRVQFDYYY
jgi:hypothetical protein